MKGVLFTEFLGLLEGQFGMETLDEIVDLAAPKLATGGAYTSVGTYPHAELLALIEATLSITEGDLGVMLDAYAERLMLSFEASYPEFFSAHADLVEFLLHVEDQMHAGVRKLYPDANPPTLFVTQLDDKSVKLVYRSARPLSVVVQPLARAAAKRYQTSVEIEQLDQSSDGMYSEHLLRIL